MRHGNGLERRARNHAARSKAHAAAPEGCPGDSGSGRQSCGAAGVEAGRGRRQAHGALAAPRFAPA